MTKKKERGSVNEKNGGQSRNDRSILASCIVSEPELRNKSAPWGAYIGERLCLGVRGRGDTRRLQSGKGGQETGEGGDWTSGQTC